MKSEQEHVGSELVQLPSPTIWPMVLALGLALICAALVTNLYIGMLGLILFVASAVGWFLQVLPHEHHVGVPVIHQEIEIVSSRRSIDRLPTSEMHRKLLPIESFHISPGLKGGIAGGVAMVIPAALFSFLRYHSIWYAANLLAAGGFVSWIGASDSFLSQFHMQGFLAALVIHGVTSLLVGLLYGAMLPMYPKYPIVTAGFMIPLLFTGILYSTIGVVSPILNERIDWFWFVISQVAFGLVCGFVVNLQAKVRTAQFQALPFAVRAGIHAGMIPVTDEPHDSSVKEVSPDE